MVGNIVCWLITRGHPSLHKSAQGTVLADIAKSRVEIDQARLLVLTAAHLVDTIGGRVSLRRATLPSRSLLTPPPSPQSYPHLLR